MIDYKHKYLKYKFKYFFFKKQLGGNLFLKAILEEDIKTISKLFLENPEIINQHIQFDGYNRTPLSIAINENKQSVIDFLFRNGVNINLQDSNENVPLFVAIEKNNIKVINFLIENNANVNYTKKNGFSVLHLAVIKGSENIIFELLKKHVIYKSNSSNIYAPIFLAVILRKSKLIKLLCSKTSDNGKDEYFKEVTPLFLAVSNNDIETVGYLLECNVDLELECKGSTPLYKAVELGFIGIVLLLLTYGALTSKINEYTELTPLHIAAKKGHTEIIKALLKNNTKLYKTVENKCLLSPLIEAIINGHFDVVKVFIDNKVDINFTTSNNKIALIEAVIKGNLPIIKILLDNGAFINKKTNGTTALIEAIKHGKLDVINLLISYGVDLNLSNNKLKTPLDIAYMCQTTGNVENIEQIIQLLEDEDADYTIII